MLPMPSSRSAVKSPATCQLLATGMEPGLARPGVFRLGFFWVLDTNGDHMFEVGEQAFPFGGLPGDVPVTGKWFKP